MLDCNVSCDLPPEIQDRIFECAARMHPKYAPTLSVISMRVQVCVERVIYESLYLFPAVSSSLPFPRPAEVASLPRFLPTFHRRPSEFFATRVRNIYFQPSVRYRDAKLILEKCTRLEHLAILVMPRHPQVRDAGPLILPSADTLQSLIATRDILQVMAGSGIVFPRLEYLWIGVFPDFTPVPALKCLPALHTVDFFLWKEPGVNDWWQDDVKSVMSTVHNLRSMTLFAHEDHLIDLEQWKETSNFMSSIKIDTQVYTPFERFLLNRWRRLTIGITDMVQT